MQYHDTVTSINYIKTYTHCKLHETENCYLSTCLHHEAWHLERCLVLVSWSISCGNTCSYWAQWSRSDKFAGHRERCTHDYVGLICCASTCPSPTAAHTHAYIHHNNYLAAIMHLSTVRDMPHIVTDGHCDCAVLLCRHFGVILSANSVKHVSATLTHWPTLLGCVNNCFK